MKRSPIFVSLALLSCGAGAGDAHAQEPYAVYSAAAPVSTPADYVIGLDDVLVVMFFGEKDMSAEVVVRPDGNITLPLLNDVKAAGLTPDRLRENVVTRARQFIADPTATVIVKQINSRKVFVMGAVEKPGPYVITAPTTVLQLLALAGGLREWANAKDIVILRMEEGRHAAYRFNFKEVSARRNMRTNIELKPGDTVVVP